MITLHFNGLSHEYVINHYLEGQLMQTLTMQNQQVMLDTVKAFALLEKGLACGKTYAPIGS